MLKRLIFIVSLIVSLPGFAQTHDLDEQKIHKEAQILGSQARGLSMNVLTLALKAYHYSQKHGVSRKHILTVVDYRLPSSKQRLWVFDLAHQKLLYKSLVAHGSGSGHLYAKHFSNIPNSHASSIGIYKTSKTYFGHYGYSLRLIGLDKGFNSNARYRDIVIHGSTFVNKRRAQHHHVGNSWGCLALPINKSRGVIDTIKQGTLIFAYYPDQRWLHLSRFLNYEA